MENQGALFSETLCLQLRKVLRGGCRSAHCMQTLAEMLGSQIGLAHRTLQIREWDL